jgi:hypothetical protein
MKNRQQYEAVTQLPSAQSSYEISIPSKEELDEIHKRVCKSVSKRNEIFGVAETIRDLEIIETVKMKCLVDSETGLPIYIDKDLVDAVPMQQREARKALGRKYADILANPPISVDSEVMGEVFPRAKGMKCSGTMRIDTLKGASSYFKKRFKELAGSAK